MFLYLIQRRCYGDLEHLVIAARAITSNTWGFNLSIQKLSNSKAPTFPSPDTKPNSTKTQSSKPTSTTPKPISAKDQNRSHNTSKPATKPAATKETPARHECSTSCQLASCNSSYPVRRLAGSTDQQPRSSAVGSPVYAAVDLGAKLGGFSDDDSNPFVVVHLRRLQISALHKQPNACYQNKIHIIGDSV